MLQGRITGESDTGMWSAPLGEQGKEGRGWMKTYYLPESEAGGQLFRGLGSGDGLFHRSALPLTTWVD